MESELSPKDPWPLHEEPEEEPQPERSPRPRPSRRPVDAQMAAINRLRLHYQKQGIAAVIAIERAVEMQMQVDDWAEFPEFMQWERDRRHRLAQERIDEEGVPRD